MNKSERVDVILQELGELEVEMHRTQGERDAALAEVERLRSQAIEALRSQAIENETVVAQLEAEVAELRARKPSLPPELVKRLRLIRQQVANCADEWWEEAKGYGDDFGRSLRSHAETMQDLSRRQLDALLAAIEPAPEEADN